ncbi:MAG: bifunctional diaminohydroxyphosphoribosylaminopyrimidine deaminase/5-amino-6-(5-phosphoribosylamino)uracil reductase RibD [Candidatus Rokuibacteriota bacterium]
MNDLAWMERALELAARGRGLTSPNPMVGAVVVWDGAVVGEGWHARAGAPHAEIEALARAGSRARGATLYVNLEPCVHHGRTPPCAPALIDAGLTRVVAALEDPDPRVAGRGLAVLRGAGIPVETGLLAAEAARLNRVFLTAMREGRPHVTLKAAASLDGRIADLHGVSRWITGDPARAHAHRLRADSDAIVVGVTTALRDDPALTVRLAEPWPREPWRVVLDTHARLPVDARLIRSGSPARALVAVTETAPLARVAALEATGAAVLRVASRQGRVDVQALLAELFARDVRSVLVEGGGEVHASFVAAAAIDRVALFLAPLLLGGRSAPGLLGGAGRELKAAVRLEGLEVRRLGEDLLVEGDVVCEAR